MNDRILLCTIETNSENIPADALLRAVVSALPYNIMYDKSRVRSLPDTNTGTDRYTTEVAFFVNKMDINETNIVSLLPSVVEAHVKKKLAKALFYLSQDFKEDCIAYRVNGKGYLAGPKASKWSPFNPDYFVSVE